MLTDSLRSTMLALSRVFPVMARIVGAFMTVFGLLLVVFSVMAWLNSRPYSDGLIADGTVVDHRVRTISIDDDDVERFTSIVAYTVDGVEYRVEGNQSRPKPQSVGTAFEVSYRQGQPAEGRVVGDGAWLGLFFTGLGAFFVLLGVTVFWGGPRYARYVRSVHGQVG